MRSEISVATSQSRTSAVVVRSSWIPAVSAQMVFIRRTGALAEDKFITDAFEKLNASVPLAPLHWSVAHVPAIDRATVDRLKALGVGLALHGTRYINGQNLSGPPYRMILDSGIRAGGGSDSAQVATLNPWLVMYFMVTGKNAGGAPVNAGQQITRAEAVRLYTAANGWFLKEDDKLGSIAEGKLADVAVLTDDVFDSAKVSDEAIKGIRSVLTVIDGKIVHDTMN